MLGNSHKTAHEVAAVQSTPDPEVPDTANLRSCHAEW